MTYPLFVELSWESWVHVIGTVGAALLLLAYYLVSKKKVDGGSRFYQVLNVTGAGMLAVLTAVTGAWAAMGLNVVWVVIGVATIGRISLERKNEKKAISEK